MKKTIKKLSLKHETIRTLGDNLLQKAYGGAASNEMGCSNGPTCYNNQVCDFHTHACGSGGGGGGGGGSGSLLTCFAGGCQTIVSQ